MAEFLGKPRITKEDISGYMQDQSIIVEYFVDEMKPKIHLSVDYDLWADFERALAKKYGKFSPLNVRRAALEALQEWVQRHK